MHVPTPPALMAVTTCGPEHDVVVMFISALTTAPQDGLPDAFPCATVVVVPWFAKAAPASVRVPPPAAFVWLWVAFVKLAMVGVTIVGEPLNTRFVLVVPVVPDAVNPVILLKHVIVAEVQFVPPAETGIADVKADARFAPDGVCNHVETPVPGVMLLMHAPAPPPVSRFPAVSAALEASVPLAV